MKNHIVALNVCAVAVLAVVRAGFAISEPDELIPGSIAVVKPAKIAKFVAKPVTGSLFPLPDASNDPTVNGATLHFFDTVARPNGDFSFPLPAGANWKVLGSPAKGYKYKGAGTPGDPCKVVLLKPKVLKAVCKGADVAFTLPFQGELDAVLTVSNSKRYCAEFGGSPKGDPGKIFKRKGAAPPAACPDDVATPTPTFTPVSSVTTAPTPTVTASQTPLATFTPTAEPVDLTGSDVGFPGGTIPEGTGDDGGRPAVVILTGTGIRADALVTATFVDDGTPLTSTFTAYPDGTGAAVTVRVPVLATLAAGQARQARITVTQGASSDSITLDVDGLPELTLNAASSATVDATPDLYSRITVTGNVHFATGQASPLTLRATAGITLSNSRLDVDAAGQLGGPQGCSGGTAANPGACGIGGGGPGGNSTVIGNGSGGGGGGFGASGAAGSGGTGGAGGMSTGGTMLVPFVTLTGTAGNRGNGGGGGGSGMLVVGTAAGGVGGGGGGAMMLEAGGDITVIGANGRLSAAGASGSAGGGAAGGGGGGGSGGAILVRSGGNISTPGVWLAAAPGGAGPGNNAGGSGGVGRIRVDAGSGEVTTMAIMPSAERGPSWDVATPSVSTNASVLLQLRGQAGGSFGVTLQDVAAGDYVTDAAGTVMVPLTLQRGRNVICALWTTNASATNLDKPEARTCIHVAYVGP